MVDVLKDALSFADELGKRASMEQIVLHHHARTAGKIATHIAALEAQLAEGVKVKSLEWDGPSGHGSSPLFWAICAKTQMKSYRIDWEGYGLGHTDHPGPYTLMGIGAFPTIEAAKAAAQADFDRRILSALVEPDGTQEDQNEKARKEFSEKVQHVSDLAEQIVATGPVAPEGRVKALPENDDELAQMVENFHRGSVAFANDPEDFHHLIEFTPPRLRAFILTLSALEATPPAPKATDELVDRVLDAAGDHILFQYGFGALHHPTDRQQIKNSLSGDAS